MRRVLSLLTLSLVTAVGTAGAEPFRLTLHATEYRIEKGKVTPRAVVKSWVLPAGGVARSRQYGKVSTTLSGTLDRIFDQIDARQPQPAVFRNVRGHWVAADQTGWLADRERTKARLLRAIRAGKPAAEVVYRTLVPRRSVRELARRGVLWHVSTGESSYAGSPAFRERNVLVGAAKLDNFFIAPGHEFDFNAEVGQINASTGFVKGFVISNGTLAKEDGGGICQVSTTIFRALYKAGLPVTERHEHSHRVGYYDPVGFEATVYAPGKNLRMRNDTGKYLFVQASWNRAAQTLRFDVFGANTGRRVQISPPVVTNFRPSGAPSYTPDPGVVLGQSRLLDTPAQGMTVVMRRVVAYPGGESSQDILRSVYKPWGAVYGVNPGDRRLKGS
ncbi:vancomycin resistance protein [Deinococcus aerius]|uniref:Vancomycin resistance protein n=1 Tax=Deinococcus aerius TaxID=200253 RepID=A0A2I9D8M7_9DEIO|nr:VanW family protein [Deinococcus aerius]GBF07186.1 vancomycin resistance protein [Deinococcus aerius]